MKQEHCPVCGSALGTSLTSCACGWRMLDPMPRQDVVLPPSAGYVTKAEIARLTAERDAIAALTVERCAEVAETNGFYRPDSENTAAAIRSLSPIPPHVAAARVAKVKPLVWIDRNGFWRAASAIGGVYEILEVSGTFHLSQIVHGHGSSMKPYPALEAAKAAANDDNEARIRSALMVQENSDG